MVAHRNSADSKSFPAVKPREGGMSTPLAQKVLRAEPPQHGQGTEPTPSRGERCVTGDWQWRYADAVRSRALDDGKISTLCIPRHPAMAGYARDASEKPRKPPPEDTPREDLARKGRFSLHGPLESRIVRRSCHRSAHERKGSGRKCLRFVKN